MFAIVNEQVAKFGKKELFSWFVLISIKPEILSAAGMPAPEEMKRLDDIETKILHGLLSESNLCYFGHVTGQNRRDIMLYMPSEQLAKTSVEKQVKLHFPKGNANYELVNDPTWANVGGLIK